MLTFYDIQFNGILVEISNISINMEDTLWSNNDGLHLSFCVNDHACSLPPTSDANRATVSWPLIAFAWLISMQVGSGFI